MKKQLLTFSKHFVISCILLMVAAITFGISIGASAHFGDNPLAVKLDGEGPHIFYKDQNIQVQYIRGNRDDGFYVDESTVAQNSNIPAKSYFALEDSYFNFTVNLHVETPPVSYSDNNKILAISDIESSFKTFRDFLIANQVIDKQLNWIFGEGHLVLVGDYIDRGHSTTQVLWFIYKLEQEAKRHGGHVHFILGNHEIKNLQGNFGAAEDKYFYIAGLLDKQQHELYGPDSFIGRWMASKNTMELINGHLFVHGGIHPKLADLNYSLEEINQLVRKYYRRVYLPRTNKTDDDFLISTRTGPSWYRGYFKEDLTQAEIEAGLNKFGAEAVVVGHTIQSKVKQLFNGKVLAIDVKHPRDYSSTFPFRNSEGLLIEKGQYFRVLDDGTKKEI